MPDLRLPGVTSSPLSGYLKALGVLRLLATQADPAARGRWVDGVFELRSELDLEGLQAFLLDDYAPSPILSPWNGGSGFHPKDKGAGQALQAAASVEHPRFDRLREGIIASRTVLDRLGISDKPEGSVKTALLHELRASLPDQALEWLDCSAIVLADRVTYPPVLGSGGNDARFEFSGNYLAALVRLFKPDGFPTTAANMELESALLRSSARLDVAGAGHLVRDGSPTSSADGQGANLANSWDLVLSLEGALVLGAGATRRHAASEGQLAAPFTTAPSAAGYGSAAEGEKGRGELWLPLWPGWASLPEVLNLAREGRMAVGRRPARNGLDAMRAARTLGVASGVRTFERVALLERAGQSGLAVAAGRIHIHEATHAGLLQRIDPWLRRVLRLAIDGPSAQRLAAGELERAAFTFAADPDPLNTQRLLIALAAAERALALAGAKAPDGLRPVQLAVGADWLTAADDGSAELACAAGIAALRQGRHRPAVRDHLLGTGVDRHGQRSYEMTTVGVPMRAPAAMRLGRLQIRRFLDAARLDEALSATTGVDVPLGMLASMSAGAVDMGRVAALAEGLSLADWRSGGSLAAARLPPAPMPAFELLTLAWHGSRIIAELVGPRPEWPSLLLADRVARVIGQAHLRLRMAGLDVLVEPADLSVSHLDGPSLAVATLIPPTRSDLRRIVARLSSTPTDKEPLP